MEIRSRLSRNSAIAENYPDLKANTNVSQLMEELTTTENKISYARQFFNDSATKFNTKIEIFPNNVIVGFFGGKFESFPLFEVTEAERGTPNVDLNF